MGTSAATGYYQFTPTVMAGWTVVAGYPEAVQRGQKFTVDVQRGSDGTWDETNLAIAAPRFTTGATVSGVSADSVTLVTPGATGTNAVIRVSFTVDSNLSTSATYNAT